jgi:hypothetical protein
MKTLDIKLADSFAADGWDLAQRHAQDLEWWADEIWELKSRWSPEGASAFVTFLVDPMWEGNRSKGQGIWAVGCSAGLPRSRGDAERECILRLKGSKEEIEEFVDVVNGFRSSHGSV